MSNFQTHPIKSDYNLNSSVYDYLCIGPVPNSEPCTQVGENDYTPDQKAECNAYINQLIRTFGLPPGRAYYFILKNTGHDFGAYYEAAIMYRDGDEAEADYAFSVECGAENWDDQAREELRHTHSNFSVVALKIAS